MSNVIAFLEAIGQDAGLRHSAQGEIQLALANARIDPELQAAILGKDQQRLEAVLGAATNVCCGLMPSREDEEEDEPARDDDEITARRPGSGIASAA